MKKIVGLLVLVALCVAVAHVANAQYTRQVAVKTLKWVKADGNGATTYDSTSVNLLFVSATNGSDYDTTEAFDLAQVALPARPTSADSMCIVGLSLTLTHSDGGASTSADTVYVQKYYSVDGQSWTVLGADTVAVVGGGNGNTIVDTYRLYNRAAAQNGPIRFLRWLVRNKDQGLDGGSTSALRVVARAQWWKGNP